MTLHCPLCAAPVDFGSPAVARAEAGGSAAPAEGEKQLQARLDRALWTAILALEDLVAFARSQRDEGQPGRGQVADAEQAAELLREIVRAHPRR